MVEGLGCEALDAMMSMRMVQAPAVVQYFMSRFHRYPLKGSCDAFIQGTLLSSCGSQASMS